ncbi:hypothetical protein FIM10_01915 [Sphingomonadales bacterium 56]|uniref:hypothetical protein n=1 Tax=unclassified Sphingobium TaxID=2611147 RepID=UPI001917DF49|nr:MULTISPECIES: hypothetical protein [unclassified Sphingobium]MBY2927440.1 hypothetical protein [Sphingomonadales bacterium 56]MBY2957508.1 hypothetical protein [Sphingomonadales bacterium 58]MBY2957551.1 hypothetical protein [Sphingomonadales bacterium 58]CAD7335199.1 hypothetical protein SPHS8_00387 [Sphingobium sp. S8]CAD7335218.1 hypothetical protein SPHS6_00387 [Sphingobium sp. S6]
MRRVFKDGTASLVRAAIIAPSSLPFFGLIIDAAGFPIAGGMLIDIGLVGIGLSIVALVWLGVRNY